MMALTTFNVSATTNPSVPGGGKEGADSTTAHVSPCARADGAAPSTNLEAAA